jgi:hypothetical protein
MGVHVKYNVSHCSLMPESLVNLVFQSTATSFNRQVSTENPTTLLQPKSHIESSSSQFRSASSHLFLILIFPLTAIDWGYHLSRMNDGMRIWCFAAHFG